LNNPSAPSHLAVNCTTSCLGVERWAAIVERIASREMTTSDLGMTMSFDRVAAGHWTTTAGLEWSNPGGELWGGYAIGACVRVLENEPEARGEALSLNLTYTSALASGEVDVRT